MGVSFDQKLVEYMQKKGYAAVSVEAISPKGCCADTAELCTGFVKPADLATVKAKAWRVLPADDFEVILLTRGIEYDEDVTLGLRSFLGAKDVTLKGMRPWKL